MPYRVGAGRHLARSELLDVYGAEAPFATAYLSAPSARAGASDRLRTGWEHARRRLAREGVADAVLDEMGAAVERLGHGGGASVMVVADRSGVVVEGHLPEELAADVAVGGLTPRLVPLIESQQEAVPHVIVHTDRTGADIYAVAQGALVGQHAVEGETEHITRSKPGGWSQRRFQQRAENTWQDNAREVAREVAEVIEEVGAAVVVLAGDVRARHLLVDELSDAHRALVVDIERAEDTGSVAALAAEAVRAQATVAAEHTVAVLAEFGEARATGRGADGVADTLGALRRGQVRTLLVVDDTFGDETRTAWCGDDPTMVALGPETAGEGSVDLTEGPLTDLAVRAALAQDAEVRVVPSHGRNSPAEGMGAILRFRLADSPGASGAPTGTPETGAPTPAATDGEEVLEEYSSWTKAQLVARARELGIAGRSRMSRDELITALMAS